MKFKHWITIHKYDNKLVLSDNNENVTRLVRRYNFEGLDACCLTMTSIADQAMNILMIKNSTCNASLPQLIDNDAAVLLVKKIIENNQGIYSFVPSQCYSTATFTEVLRTINILRCEETTALFRNKSEGKVQQLKQLISEYEDTLKNRRLLDPIMLLNEALKCNVRIDCDQCGLIEFSHITALEKKFVERFFPKYELLDPTEEKNCIKCFAKAYGISNEISAVADEIIEKSHPLGDVSLIYSNREYDHLIEAVFNEKGIDFSFTSERLSDSSRLVQIIRTLMAWHCSDYDYALLKNLVYTDGFIICECNTVSEYNKAIQKGIWFGSNRYFDKGLWANGQPTDPHFIEALQAIIRMLEKHGTDLIAGNFLEDLLNLADQYCVVYPEKEKEKKKIANLAKALKSIDYRCNLTEAYSYIDDRLKSTMFSETSDNQKVEALMINTTPMVLSRLHNYFIGLSDRHFTASAVESPVLSDALIGEYLIDGAHLLAANKELRHQDAYNKSIEIISGDAWFSYSYFDTVKMSTQAPSAYFSSLLEQNDANPLELNCYNDKINDHVKVASSRMFDYAVTINDSMKDNALMFSPTALNTLMECPLRYYYQYIRKLNMDEVIARDETQWLQANETGTFFHDLMENYMKRVFMGKSIISNQIDQTLFDKLFIEETEKTVNEHPYPNERCFKEELDELREAATRYLASMHKEFADPQNQWRVFACEMNLKEKGYHTTVSGETKTLDIQVKGFADRVDERIDENGVKRYRIVDYKTGKYKKQAEKVKKGETCQHDLYQMVIAKTCGQVDEFDYVFPFEKNASVLRVNDFVDGIPQKAKDAITAFFIDHQIIPDEKKKPSDLKCAYCPLRHQCMYYTTRED